MNKFSRISITVLLVGAFAVCFGQASSAAANVQIINPQVRSPADVQSTWRGGINVVSWWLNGLGQQAARGDLRRAVERSIANQKQFLEWTGRGVLLNARVITRVDPNTPLRLWAVLGDGASAIGSGKTPEEALLMAWREDRWNAGIPDGWTVDQTMSTYMWVKLQPDGGVVTEGVPKGTMHELNTRVRENWALMETQRLESEIDNLDAWDRIVKSAHKRLSDRESRLAVEATYRDIAESQKRVREINEVLKTALAEARKAEDTARMISTMQGVLSVAQLADMAIEGLNIPSADISDQSTGAGVAAKAESIRDGRVQYVSRLQVEFDGSINDLRKFLNQLYVQILPANPPAGVRESLMVTKPQPP